MILLMLIALFSFGGVCYSADAGPDDAISAHPVTQQGGSFAAIYNVAPNTSTVVMISSPCQGSNLPSYSPWRVRYITNYSTHGALVLYPDNVQYNQFSSTQGISLSSFNATSGAPSRYETHYEGPIYGIWDKNAFLGTAGSSAWQEYVK